MAAPTYKRAFSLDRFERSNYILTAFTLVELLVAIAIIAVVISMLLPTFSRARESGNRIACLSNEQQILAAIITYANDHHGFLPGPAIPCINTPLTVNLQPGYPPDPSHLTWSQMDAWESSTVDSSRELSNPSLLQSYLGGIAAWKIWQCPSSQEMWSNAAPVFPNGQAIDAYFNGCHLGFGYQINNVGTWDKTYPKFLFGEWYTTASGDELNPKKLSAIRLTTSIDPTLAGTGVDDVKNSTFNTDSTKIWLISDLDGRGFTGAEGGVFGITGPLVEPFTIEDRNNRLWQPVHCNGSKMPTVADPHSGLGRNYGFLDGHAEWLGYDDWPGAHVPGSHPN